MDEIKLAGKDGVLVATISAAHPKQRECDRGVWVELQAADGTRPTLCLIQPEDGPWYLGVYRDAQATDVRACDLAVLFDTKDGPQLQVTRGGEILNVSLFALAKLAGA